MSNEVKQEAPERIWVQLYESLIPECLSVNAYTSDPRNVHDSGKPVYEYVRADPLATVRREEREAALNESAESIVNEAGKVGQLMDLASASARKEERSAIKSMLEDYFKHFFCTCHGSTRTGGHFASCLITIRDEVLGRLQGLEASANQKGEVNG